MALNPSQPSDVVLRWHVFRCRRKSDTSTRFLLELARCVARAPRSPAAPPFLEIGTRSGGSALLMLRVLRSVYDASTGAPFVFTIDPYGSRPYEGGFHVYDARHYRAMKRALAPFPNHIHYMMDSELFLQEMDHFYWWSEGTKRFLNQFTLVYLDGSHDPDIVWNELQRLWPRVIPGGYLIVDDINLFGGEVRHGIDAAAPGLGADLRHNGKQGILRKTAR